MFSFHAAFPRGSRRRRSRGAADGRRPRARERRKKCSDRYTCYHTTRCPLGLGYKGALPGSCTPSTPSDSIQARVSRANDGKSTNTVGREKYWRFTALAHSPARRATGRRARGARATTVASRCERASGSREATPASRRRRAGRGRRCGGDDERGTAALPSPFGCGDDDDVDERLMTCWPRRRRPP